MPAVGPRLGGGAEHDTPALGELGGVAEQVGGDLPHPHRIADDPDRQVRRQLHIEHDPLPEPTGAHHRGDLGQLGV